MLYTDRPDNISRRCLVNMKQLVDMQVYTLTSFEMGGSPAGQQVSDQRSLRLKENNNIPVIIFQSQILIIQ